LLAGLRRRRDVERHRPVHGLHLDGGAHHELRIGDLDLGEDVRPLAPQARVLLDVQHHVEVAARPAIEPRLALAREAQPGAGLDARRDRDLERPLLLDATVAMAALARVVDDRAAAAALRAGARHGEEALLEPHLAHAAAGAARGRRRAARAAGAAAVGADLDPRHAQGARDAEGRLLEGELEVVAEVAARLPAPAAGAAAAEQVAEAEEVAEDVGEVAEGLRVEAGEAALRTEAA